MKMLQQRKWIVGDSMYHAVGGAMLDQQVKRVIALGSRYVRDKGHNFTDLITSDKCHQACEYMQVTQST